MAKSKGRTYGKIFVRIWLDEDFRALPVAAQHLYLHLVSSPTLTPCGTVDFIPDRLVPLAADLTTSKIVKAAARLEADRFVVIDRRTSELLIRSFIRHDEVLKNPNITVSMARAHALISSATLRAAVVAELARLHRQDPLASGWDGGEHGGLKAANPDLYARITSEPLQEVQW